MSDPASVVLIGEKAQTGLEVILKSPSQDAGFVVSGKPRTLVEAKALLSDRPADAAFLCLNLPDSQGLATFLALRDLFPDLWIRVLCPPGEEAEAARAVEEGARGFQALDPPDAERALGFLALVRKHKKSRALFAREMFPEGGVLERALAHVAEGVSTAVGQEFFRSLVRHLAGSLSADFALVGERVPGHPNRLRTVAVWSPEGFAENFEYDLAGTPCEKVVNRGTCSYPQNVRELFPEDMLLVDMGIESYIGTRLYDSAGHVQGLMAILDRKKRTEVSTAESLLKIFGVRASAEMERRLAEMRATESRLMLKQVFEGISDPLVLMDRDLTVRMVNRALRSYYGVTDDRDLTGLRCHERFWGRETPCEGCTLPDIVAGSRREVFERKSPLNAERMEKVVVYPANGHGTQGAIIRIRDITEEKALQARLIQNEKLATLGLLVSGIAHEISNPNNFISFNLPIMRDYLQRIMPVVDEHFGSDPGARLFGMSYPEFREDVFRLLENVAYGSSRIESIVRRLKEFSRMEDNQEKTWFDPVLAVEKALNMCRPQMEKTVRKIEMDLPESAPRVFSSPMALEQVLLNLLMNAAHAADKEDSLVRVGLWFLESPQALLSLVVEDNGAGMDKATLERLFSPFFTQKAPGMGTGLGLYVSRSLIEALGGRIEVKSRPGEGSLFRVLVPVRTEDRESIHAA